MLNTLKDKGIKTLIVLAAFGVLSLIYFGDDVIATLRTNVTVLTGGSISEGLVLHWTFDGSNVLNDESGNGNHGTIHGQTSTSTVSGRIGQGFGLDGGDDYVSATVTEDKTTIAFWAKDANGEWNFYVDANGTQYINGEEEVWDNTFYRIIGDVLEVGRTASTTISASFNASDQLFSDGQALDTDAEGVQDGSLTVKDGGGVVQIVNDWLSVNGSGAFNDTGFVSGSSAQSLGKAVKFQFKVPTSLQTSRAITISDDAALSGTHFFGIHPRSTGDLRFEYWDGTDNLFTDPVSYSADTEYTVVIMPGGYDSSGTPYYSGQTKSNYLYGASAYIKGGDFEEWTLLYQHKGQTFDPWYVTSEGNGEVQLNHLFIPDKDLSEVLEPTNYSSFDGTNGTSLDAITPEVADGWTENNADWDIQNNKAHPIDESGGPGGQVATVESGASDVFIRTTVQASDAGSNECSGVTLRYTDNDNYWGVFICTEDQAIEINERNGGTNTVRASSAFSFSEGQEVDMTVRAEGSTISVWLDGGNKLEYTSASHNQDATRHGLFALNQGVANTVFMNDFHVQPLSSSTYTSEFNIPFHQGAIDDFRIYDRTLSATEIQRLNGLGNTMRINKTLTTASELKDGLIAHWTLDGTDLKSTVTDRSGQGNHGSIQGQSSTTTAPGRIGQGLKLDGVDDYLELPATSSTTIAFWAKEDGGDWNFYVDSDGTQYVNGGEEAWDNNFYQSSEGNLEFGRIIQASSIDDPADITGLELWLRADAGTLQSSGGSAADSDGDPVGEWEDQSGNGIDFTQSTASSKPTLKLDMINKQPLIRFDGSNDDLSRQSDWLSGAQGAVFMVGMDQGGRSPLSLGFSASTNQYMVFYYDFNESIGLIQRESDTNDRIYGDDTYEDNVPLLGMWSSTGSSYHFRLNGEDQDLTVEAGSNSGDWFGDTTIQNWWLGRQTNGFGTNYFEVDIAEIVIYNSYLSSSDISDVESYLGNKYGFGDFFDGVFDDIRVYDRALSLDEIERLHGLGGTARINVTREIPSDSTRGLVGHWSLDGKTLYSNVADISGQGFHGSLQRQPATTTTIGAIGQALRFDGLTEYIDIGSAYNDVKSVSFWVRLDVATTSILQLNSSAKIEVEDQEIITSGITDPTIYVDGEVGSTIDGNWRHVTVTTDTGIDASDLHLARVGQEYLAGSLDDVRLYSNVLPLSHIARLRGLGGTGVVAIEEGISIPALEVEDLGTPEFWYISDTEVEDPDGNPAEHNDLVDVWRNQGSMALDTAAVTEEWSPIYQSNILNGYPSVQFDGSDHYLKHTAEREFVSDGVVIVVVKPDGGGSTIVGGNRGGTALWMSLGIVGSVGVTAKPEIRIQALEDSEVVRHSAEGNILLAEDTPYVIAYVNTGISYQIYVNGNKIPVTMTSGVNDGFYWFDDYEGCCDDGFSLGATVGVTLGNSASREFEGDMFEVFMHDASDLTQLEILGLMENMMQKYGI